MKYMSTTNYNLIEKAQVNIIELWYSRIINKEIILDQDRTYTIPIDVVKELNEKVPNKYEEAKKEQLTYTNYQVYKPEDFHYARIFLELTAYYESDIQVIY